MVVPGEDVSYELGTPEQQEIEQKPRNLVLKQKTGFRVEGHRCRFQGISQFMNNYFAEM